MIALAEDAYKSEAKLARDSITDAAKRAMDDAEAHIRRSEIVIAPADESDAVHIIQKRLSLESTQRLLQMSPTHTMIFTQMETSRMQ